ncbi:T-lymphocyte surface antigen Ly-9-like [Alligator mississippiensis]|uniref:T-lymphocyte surface antigen Ly-9-like n=1 Tax=Alligator mississippiensis TaxID=8496 RepID=UPI0028773A29|nr:T-lymphocyte surface antigen Ly-9-like [Alligator mississippiensis]
MAAVGETVRLQPKTWPSSLVAINWKVKLGSQTYWILGHNQNRTSASPFLPFADRVSFHPGNLSLQINLVTEKESGLYTMDLKLGDGSGITNNFRLFVLGHVRQPKIKASTSQECGWCYLTLSCLVPKAAWVTYSWSRGVSSSPAPEDHWLQQHQADLQLEISKSSNTFYHCNVSNAISWGMATIDVEPLCNYTGWSGAGTEAPTTEVVRTPEAALTELVGTPGETVTFPLEIPAGETLDTAAWTIGTENLAMAIAGDPLSVVVSDRSYRGRLRVPNDSLSLHITDLRLEDAGTYTAQVNTDKSQFTRLFTLHIYERLPEPMIHCNAQSCVNGSCNMTLSCTIPNGGNKVTYSWSTPQPLRMFSQGSIVIITHPDLLINVTCTVQNPASSSSTMASVKALCAVPATMPAQASSLSYCQAKGLILLLVLGALITGTVAVHIMAASWLSYCQTKGFVLLLVLAVLITSTVAVHIMAGKQPKQD